MQPSQEIIDFIKRKEGFKANAYRPLPTDRPTIGYGSTYYYNGSVVQLGDTITEYVASQLLANKLDTFAEEISKFTNGKCTQQQFDAVLSLCYNVGVSAIQNSTTGIMFKNGEDISDRFVMWNKSGGQEIPGLTARRLEEKQIYITGTYPE